MTANRDSYEAWLEAEAPPHLSPDERIERLERLVMHLWKLVHEPKRVQ